MLAFQKLETLYGLFFRIMALAYRKKTVRKYLNLFFSTKDPTSGNGGEGLGLFVVWNILKMYKGKIQLNRKFKDGAQFIITIPIMEENYESSSNN